MQTPQPNWHCIKNCGACCRLAPEERPEAIEALNSDQVEIYLNMVGDDGWCIHFDRFSRSCSIYDERPDFCRVSNLSKLFQIESDSSNSFAISCCIDQIKSIYGKKSKEMGLFFQELELPEENND